MIYDKEIYGNVDKMKQLLYGAIVFMVLLGSLLITVLSFWNARPIKEILYLTERIAPNNADVPYGAALDRIQMLLSNMYLTGDEYDGQCTQIFEVTDGNIGHDTQEGLPKKDGCDNIADETATESRLICNVIEYIESHMESEAINASTVAQAFNMELSNLSHQFKNRTGYALSDYMTAKKLSYACRLLTGTNMSVNAIAEKLGYSNGSSLIRIFKKVYGITPTQYRNNPENVIDQNVMNYKV